MSKATPLRAHAADGKRRPALTLYTRRGCPLCEDMGAQVLALLGDSAASLALVDVDTDAGLKARFGWDVPLLFAGETEICRHELDLPAFRAWAQAHL